MLGVSLHWEWISGFVLLLLFTPYHDYLNWKLLSKKLKNNVPIATIMKNIHEVIPQIPEIEPGGIIKIGFEYIVPLWIFINLISLHTECKEGLHTCIFSLSIFKHLLFLFLRYC